MASNYGLLCGPLAAGILAAGVALLPMMIPGYSHVHQTVSEIGEVGSPAQVPFTLLLCAVSISIAIFAATLRELSIRAGRSPAAAYLTGCMALSAVGVGVFAYPHPLHSNFGLSELIGYQAPLVPALTWHRDSRFRSLVRMSWIAAVLMWVSIALNLSHTRQRRLSEGLRETCLRSGAEVSLCYLVRLVRDGGRHVVSK